MGGRQAISGRSPEGAEHFTGIRQADFRLLIEINADGILVVDQSGAVRYANPAARRIFGLPQQDLLQVPLGLPLAGNDTTEIAVRRPDGRLTEVEMRVVEIFWDAQPAFLASLRDISARKAEEERRRQAHKMEALGQLTASVTHDFNNLILVVATGLRALEQQLTSRRRESGVDLLTDSMRESIETIRRSVRHGSTLMQRLLAFARRQPLTPAAVDVNVLLEQFIPILRRAVGDGVAVVFDAAPGAGQVFADASQLEMALLNLAVNARDAMRGKGTLTIRTASVGRPDGAAEQAGAAELVRISVEDTGHGMSREVVAQAFDPFFTTKGEEGTGLGLSQVYGFVTQSGGDVRIDSESGRGTVVHILLPRHRQAAAAPRAQKQNPRPLP